MRLRHVLNDDQVVPAGYVHDRVHVARVAKQVDRDDGAGAVGDAPLQVGRVGVEGIRVPVREHRDRVLEHDPQDRADVADVGVVMISSPGSGLTAPTAAWMAPVPESVAIA